MSFATGNICDICDIGDKGDIGDICDIWYCRCIVGFPDAFCIFGMSLTPHIAQKVSSLPPPQHWLH